MSNIGVIGIGRLGLSFALLAAKYGYHVYGCDARENYISSLNNLTYTTSEPLIVEYLKEENSFYPGSDISETVESADILFCFVATPSLPDGSYDHSAIDKVVADLQELHVQGLQMDGKILVIGCTTMPGYCDTVQSRLESTGISVAYNPEFIAQGDIINGLRTADMILIGATDEPTVHALQGIYRTIMTKEPKFNIMSRTAAEITKISINCYLTMKIAYANMIGEIAIESGVGDEKQIMLDAIGDDSRIGRKLTRYGFGFGGPCLPRDNRALGIHADDIGVQTKICQTTDTANTFHARYLREHFIKLNPDKEQPFLFTQLTYKPGVDLLVESQQYRLCRDLLEAGYCVDIREQPSVIEQVQKELSVYGERVIYGTATNGITIDI